MVALAPITNETSTWDVLDAFSKPHSRVAALKTSSCTEARPLKSRGGIEIWLTVYETSAGLESLTRDPIGTLLILPLYEYAASNPRSRVDPLGLLDGGADGDVDTISCEQFLQVIPTLDPDDWPAPNRARDAFNRGPHIFCGDCDKFQNYSFAGKDGICHICLGSTDKSVPNGGPLESHSQQWIASLVHELVHCDQYKCGGKIGTPPSLGDPIPPTDPKWIPPEHQDPNGPNCARCKQQEGHAYNEQCRVLFPGDDKKQKDCMEAGKCYSCAYVCGKKQSACPKFPVFVPQGK